MQRSLHMVQMKIATKLLFRENRSYSYPRIEADPGYALHCLLAELFGEHSPKPFSMESSMGGEVIISGYAPAAASALLEHAQLFAGPDLFAALEGGSLLSKELPNVFRPGMRLGFRVRVCPVVRKEVEVNGKTRVIESDAYRDKASLSSREEVYSDWLQKRFAASGAAEINSLKLCSYTSVRLLRRTQGNERCSHTLQRPACVFEGVLTVCDGDRFFELLCSGIGRHKAFGFGMLLIRPAGKL